MGLRHVSTKRLLLLASIALLAPATFAQTTNDDADARRTTTTAATTTAATTATAAATTATTAAATTDGDTTAALPTLSATGTTYSYPAPSVPPTQNAPYMQTSSLPDGTVFIAVGTILGVIGAAVLVWRAMVAWLLHRNVKKAALAQHMANDKVAYAGRAPSAPFYKYSDQASSPSLGGHGHTADLPSAAAGRAGRRASRQNFQQHHHAATPSQSNLFFSPTARPGADGGAANNRSSTFLPSGFYAASNGNNGGPTPQHAHNHSIISMSNLRPDSRGGESSPGPSPHLPPTRRENRDRSRSRRNPSTSTLNLNQPPPVGTRAPSAYLENLLAEEGSSPGTGHGFNFNH